MGFFNDIEVQIMEWQARGCSPIDTYIHFKDYVTFEQVRYIFNRDCDEDVVLD